MIDRYNLVSRHNPALNKSDILSPFSVGNGEFAFTTDITGLQTFVEEYDKIPLCTMSNWGFHNNPLVKNISLADLKPQMFDFSDRKVGYYTSFENQETTYNLLRENPHRYNLGNIGFKLLKSDGNEAEIHDLEDINQTLDLWTGTIVSSFTLEGDKVSVFVCCHPKADTIVVKVTSALLIKGRLSIKCSFPYASFNKNGSDWLNSSKHQTKIKTTEESVYFERALDNENYFVNLNFNQKIFVRKSCEHTFDIRTEADEALFTANFSPNKTKEKTDFEKVFVDSKIYWESFWRGGGAVEILGDEKAFELERRVILSQYLTAIQCSGSIPPQETGLTCNSWYGKAHLEMHWWHSVQFALWGRKELLKKSMWWYKSIMPKAKETAKNQGYRGARWPKMVSPTGDETPSPIGPLLVWQQPHIIYIAEILYKLGPESLEEYKDLVFETADFLESFLEYDGSKYNLIPPLIPSQECHKPLDVKNPAFELKYVHFALKTAQKWRVRLGMRENDKWNHILENLAKIPQTSEFYIAHENCKNTFEGFNTDHPSMLMAMGFLEGDNVDKRIMKNTLEKVLKEWNFETVWGWDFAVLAMTAAKLGDFNKVLDCLLLDKAKNIYLNNGHNYQTEDLPIYLPGNGGLLAAISVIIGCFGEDGVICNKNLTLKYENILPL